MLNRLPLILSLLAGLLFGVAHAVSAQDAKPADKPAPPEFRWVNPLPKGKTYSGVQHATYHSKLMDRDVGYCIYLPPGYDDTNKDDTVNAEKRYPVVYYLHGGRPGSEIKSVSLAEPIDKAMRAGDVPPMISTADSPGVLSRIDVIVPPYIAP
jgi:endo-1,4-beta-xylanase